MSKAVLGALLHITSVLKGEGGVTIPLPCMWELRVREAKTLSRGTQRAVAVRDVIRDLSVAPSLRCVRSLSL